MTLEPQGEPLLTVKQLATFLNVNERTVLKLATDGALPGVKVGNQWRFRKATIDTWLDDQMIGVRPRYVDTPMAEGPPRRMLELSNCFQPEHIIPELGGTSKTAIIEELALKAAELGLVRDKTWFMGALIERENVMPSAIGNGIAFLHTLHRNPERVTRPFMVLGRSSSGVDFDSLDGKATHLFFVLGLKYTELHLPWLQKLSQILIDRDRVRSLMAAEDAQSIFKILQEAERSLAPAPIGSTEAQSL